MLLLLFLCALVSYLVWTPGKDVLNGSHDLKRNGIWISHGWLGGDDWFIRNNKTNELARYRKENNIRALATRLSSHHITDVFPHLCPADERGHLPPVDVGQTELFLDTFAGFRVLPWIGGASGPQTRYADPQWRAAFVVSINELLAAHPRLAGVHLNIEPLTSGDENYLKLLAQMRAGLPAEKILSVAAYPPPTRWQPSADVHWSQDYYQQVARHSDQMVVMMYDTAVDLPKCYQKLMADWTREVLAWSDGKAVLLGLPAYEDAGVNYHRPQVENLTNALLGIHSGLGKGTVAANYQGVALYSEWEMSEGEWHHLDGHFLKP